MTLVLVLRPRKAPSLRRTEWRRKYEHEKERGRNPETDRSILHWGGEKVIMIVWPGNYTSSMCLVTHVKCYKVFPLSLIFIITHNLLSCPEESEDFLMHKANQVWERVEEENLWDASNAQRAFSSVSATWIMPSRYSQMCIVSPALDRISDEFFWPYYNKASWMVPLVYAWIGDPGSFSAHDNYL